MNTNIKEIRELVEKETGVNLDIKSRKREVVQARRIYYKILSMLGGLSLEAIGKTLKIKQNHTSVLHQVKMFDIDYEQDKIFNKTFRKIMGVCDDAIEFTEDDILKYENINFKNEVKRLKRKIEELKEEIVYLKGNSIQPKNQQTKVYYASEGISNLIY